MLSTLLTNKAQKGFLGINICILIFIFSGISLLVHNIFLSQIKQLKHKLSYTATYAEALSGIRAAPLVWDSISTVENSSINKSFLKTLPPISLNSLNLTLAKSSDTLYSYSERENYICLLKASITSNTNTINLSDLSFVFYP